MKYVPSLPPPIAGVEDRLDVTALTGIRPVKRVQERTLPPLVSRPRQAQSRPQPQLPSAPVKKNEKVRAETYHEERRVYNRRAGQQSILMELRSARGRRQHRQGAGATNHIDEEA